MTLERPDLVRHLTTVNKPRNAPVVLSQEEVARLLEAAPGLKYKAALSVAYGAGPRVSEVANLKVSDIDSQRMTLRVEQGKGQRDRYVMLSPQLLELLREWWRAARPQASEFAGRPIRQVAVEQSPIAQADAGLSEFKNRGLTLSAFAPQAQSSPHPSTKRAAKEGGSDGGERL